MRKDSFSVRGARSDADTSRIAVIAPRSVGSAVVRNRARRRVREAFQKAFASAGAYEPIDVVVTVRPDAARADFRAIEADARASLADLGR